MGITNDLYDHVKFVSSSVCQFDLCDGPSAEQLRLSDLDHFRIEVGDDRLRPRCGTRVLLED